ncbi:MAG: sugar phosphate isomerase/epimerase [Planctomycetales bacterium]|nr:sugar phosphate isomerase/epimerase [Planctomycetales bacterium]
MFRNLNPYVLSISGRQGELLEIALTYRFTGLTIDIREVADKAKTLGMEAATKYLLSARIKIGGFELPVRFAGPEADFKADLAGLKPILDAATALGASRCFVTIQPTSDELPFHENFKFLAIRLKEVAAVLAERGIKLGLRLLAGEAHRNNGGYQFIHQAEPLMMFIQTVAADNVGLWLDTWNWHVGGGTPEKLRALRGNQIIAVELSDIPAGVDLATITEEQRHLPGEGGQIDSAAYLATLQELGFKGPVSAAVHPAAVQGTKREALVKKAAEALDAVLLAAGIGGGTTLAGAK